MAYCARNKLILTNTYFQHHKTKRYTSKASVDPRREQIDYIMERKKFKNQVKNRKSYPGADIGSELKYKT